MTLADVALDVPVRIVGFDALDDSTTARLSGVGLRAGALVTKLIPMPLRDPVACLVGSHLLSIERWLMAHIRVEAP
jgi:Fe2+ transport system protein FeoA